MVGFDNIFGSDFTTPALTTIASPFSACGAAAHDLLAALPSDGSNSRQLTPGVMHYCGPRCCPRVQRLTSDREDSKLDLLRAGLTLQIAATGKNGHGVSPTAI